MVILRHSERQDAVDKGYKRTPEGIAWPHDAPLTEAGVEKAKEVAEDLADLHKKAGFVAVACSPYKRCLQTAAAVAARLGLPVLIDQELGEIRDGDMLEQAHRPPEELEAMCRSLGLLLLNPRCEDGEGKSRVKLFGMEPVWPESLAGAKTRFVVRIEKYIQESAEAMKNMILVTHGDAVAAALAMFERGSASIRGMGFCGRVIARRSMKQRKESEEHGVYAERWSVEFKDIKARIFRDAARAKYAEARYLAACAAAQQVVVKRQSRRASTDSSFHRTMQHLGVEPKFEYPADALI